MKKNHEKICLIVLIAIIAIKASAQDKNPVSYNDYGIINRVSFENGYIKSS